jgi:polysaccharide pyruvyl transferase CsaB
MTKEKTYQIGISGSYGGMNLGDEAILQSMIAQLRQSLNAKITVFTRNSEDTRKRHDVDHVVSVRKLSRSEVIPEIEKLDLFILGGGGILYDGDAQIYLREVMIAHEKGVPVVTYAIGAGPLKNPADQEAVRDALNRAALITVREKQAQKILEEAGVQKEIRITADPAFLLKAEPLPENLLQNEGFQNKRRIVAMSVREPGKAAPDISEDHYHAILANVADYMVDRFDADILFIPMEPDVLDVQHSHSVISKMLEPQRANVLKSVLTPTQIMSLLKECDFAVGMRLHFLIFAAIQGTPFVALPYASKVSGVLESLGVNTPPLAKVNSGRVIAYIDESWDKKENVCKAIKEKLPGLKKAAQETNDMIVNFLKGRE